MSERVQRFGYRSGESFQTAVNLIGVAAAAGCLPFLWTQPICLDNGAPMGVGLKVLSTVIIGLTGMVFLWTGAVRIWQWWRYHAVVTLTPEGIEHTLAEILFVPVPVRRIPLSAITAVENTAALVVRVKLSPEDEPRTFVRWSLNRFGWRNPSAMRAYHLEDALMNRL